MLESAWLLLIPPLVLRLLPFRPAHEQRFHALGDLLLPLFIAALATSVQVQLTELRIGELWSTSDLPEYCSTALHVSTEGRAPASMNRSLLPALLPGLLARHMGVLEALALATWISTFGFNLGLWIWGRALHSRLAGTAAALFAGTLPMAAQLSKTLSLYPEGTAILVLASAFCCLAVRHRHPALRLLAGAGVGLALLSDVRGLVWALCLAPVGLLACLGLPWKDWRRPPWLRLGLGALLFFLPIQASWFAARWAYPPNAISLEDQSDLEQRLRDIGVPATFDLPAPPGFVYGYSPPQDIPRTVLWLLEEGRQPSDAQLRQARSYGQRNAAELVDPWLPLGAGALLLSLFALWRRPQLLLAFGASVFPFLYALKRTVEVHYSQHRMVGQAQLALALLLGLAYAGIALGHVPGRSQEQRVFPPPWPPRAWPSWSGKLWWLLAALLPLAMVLNWVPSHLSPWADWRDDPTHPEGWQTLACMQTLAAGEEDCTEQRTKFARSCLQRMRADHEAGRLRWVPRVEDPR